ncbi:MAG: 5'-methylthioadenosine/adenosylhomocysteine nucleosidase [Bacteroidaceae bacterium]|nr:5'-methylthioadenosine/adenosylhomocysteine nucleosidase [Bacteroidaceae bacterium]
MKIGVLSAMTKEHDQLVHMLADARQETDGRMTFTVGMSGSNTLIMMQCGIGKVNAAVGAAMLIKRYAPDVIISTGCAGGIKEGMNVMDVVISTQVAYHDVSIPGCDRGQVQGLPALFKSDEQLVEIAVQNSQKTHCGLIVSGDQFISDAKQLSDIKTAFPDAVAVDMESAAIAQTCFLMQVPFISFRILSDTPGADHHLQQYHTFWDEMAGQSFKTTQRFLAALPERLSTLPFAF